ncbi:RNA exonuclease 1-like protein [Hypsibius exemplaris]|uniref:RNA exonuclease 1-like protein n=1 Tax=Hypsibius exemplaris TaxID=2072580 RepID=A0A9X6NRP3_HYPEX|nr:RNA exonuclease 1-like protein [Hypsibius exemplaris]
MAALTAISQGLDEIVLPFKASGLDHKTFRSSPHHTKAEVDFVRLGGRALDEGLHTAAQYQAFYKQNRQLELHCGAYCNCRDVDEATGFKGILTKKDKYPDPPDPLIPSEWKAGQVNMLLPNMYGRIWLMRERAKKDHETALSRVHKHVELEREVNRDIRFVARFRYRQAYARNKPLAKINMKPCPPNPRLADMKSNISTFQSDRKRNYAVREDAARKAGLRNPVVPVPVTKTPYNPRLKCFCKESNGSLASGISTKSMSAVSVPSKEYLASSLGNSSSTVATVPPAPAGANCGRPHCKYNHQAVERDVFSQRSGNNEFATLVPELELPSGRKSPSRGLADSLGARDEPAVGAGGSAPAVESTMSSSNGDVSIAPIPRLGLFTSTVPVLNEKPSYSDTPSYSTTTDDSSSNFYYTAMDEKIDDMQYHPILNWKVDTGSAAPPAPSPPLAAPGVKDESIDTSISSPPIQPANLTSAAALRNRLTSNDPLVALGRKPPTGGAGGVGKIPAYGSSSSGGGGGGVKRALSPGASSTRQVGPMAAAGGAPRKRSIGGAAVTDNPKPVKKKAKFSRSAEDDDDDAMEVAPPVKTVKRESTDNGVDLKELFGDDDEDSEEDVRVDLPIDMPTKPTAPKGFPKNPEKLLQTLAAALEPTAKPAAALPRSTTQPPLKRKLAPTAQQQLALRQKALEEQEKRSTTASGSSSSGGAAETVDKGNKRVAHQTAPAAATGGLVMPRVSIIPGHTNLGLAFRQQVVEKFVQIMSQMYKNPQEVNEKALQMEADIAKVSFHMVTYRNKSIQAIAHLKQQVSEASGAASTAATVKTEKSSAKELIVAPPKNGQPAPNSSTAATSAQKQNYSVAPTTSQRAFGGSDPKFWSDQDFHAAMRKYLLTEDVLVVEGYPLIQGKKIDAENRRDGIQQYIAMSGKITPERITQTRRNCCRCKKEFTVDFEGNYVNGEGGCVYHWGKAFSRRVSGEGIAAKRNCCAEDSASPGCQVAAYHVADTIPSLSGFVASQGVKAKPEHRHGVYAIDCEMIYTVGGMELARLTIVDRQLKCVYETLVRPKQRIIDCNTRFSGLKMEQFTGKLGTNSPLTTIKTIEEVHKDLLGGGLINEETILIGHSLESDLLSMKFIHRNIVDTSLVFPHRRGRPFKRALRNLMREILQKIIQEDVGGHDSREDAAACMELMMWRLRQDRDRRLV